MNEEEYLEIPKLNNEDVKIQEGILDIKNTITEDQLREEINQLIDTIRAKKRSFRDRSRLFCCGCFSSSIVLFIVFFYVFDVLKYEQTCKKSKKFLMEICDAPSLGFWTRFLIQVFSLGLLLLGLYCTGPTIVTFDPSISKVFIDKKKLFCLPSICEYNMTDIKRVYLESDTVDQRYTLSNLLFSNVTMEFTQENVNLGFGRDCFFTRKKYQLVKKINKYLSAITP